MAAQKKTNAVRALESMKVPFELIEYEFVEGALAAEDAAAKTGIPEERTFKTLVARGDKTGVLMVCVPAGKTLDLKALASASGNKKVELVPIKELTPLTGYIKGGCSPIGTKKKYPVYIDDSVLTFDYMTVNAGHQGLLFKMKPEDLIKAVDAIPAKVSH